jgi:L-iduronidase
MIKFFSVLLFVSSMVMSVWGQISYQTYNLEVDFSSQPKTFPNYWNGSGFTPGSLLLNDDMQLNIDYQSVIPNHGLAYMRPHWLLNMVTVDGHDTESPDYNFDALFGALDELVNRDVKLIFEIMGFPVLANTCQAMSYDKFAQAQSGNVPQWIPDFESRKDYLKWYEFVKTLITELEKKYGEEELKTWYFECTNEPDHHFFWQQGIPALLNYWDATSEAIKTVNPDYQFGGPGNATLLSDAFKAVLAHCDTGTNAITGKSGAVLDFISVHSKNLPYAMVDMETEAVEYIREHHPRFQDIPFWNNESDPTWGWGKPFWWRPKSWYAAFLIQSVDAHNRLIIDSLGVNFEFLVNDKGFLGDWYSRTDNARFTNNQNSDGFWLVKKPVLNAMTLLAMAAGERFDVSGFPSTRESTSVIATKTKAGQYVLLVANLPYFGPVRNQRDSDSLIKPEQIRKQNEYASLVNVLIKDMNLENPVFTHIRLDDIHGSAYGAWNSLGRPDNPTRQEYEIMAANMEPVIVNHRSKLTKDEFTVAMSPASVSMIIFSAAAAADMNSMYFPPLKDVKQYLGLNGEKKEFISWQQVSGNAVAYNVYVSYDGENYEQINPSPLLDHGYLHVLPQGKEAADYRIEAFGL